MERYAILLPPDTLSELASHAKMPRHIVSRAPFYEAYVTFSSPLLCAMRHAGE